MRIAGSVKGGELVLADSAEAIAFMGVPDLELEDPDSGDEEEVETFEKIRSSKLPYKVYQAKLKAKRSK